MLQSLGQIEILNKIFNIRGSEWSKIGVAWLIRFLYRISFVVGWTILVAMFVAKYGIYSLPYLFVLNAVFTAIGTFFYSTFIDRFSKQQIMVATVFVIGIVLFWASQISILNPVLFFSLMIVVISVFLMQFRIILIGYTEEMFTSLESERTFPVIEASETLGGIVAGIMITFFASYIPTFKFVYLMIAVLFLTIPLILFYRNEDEAITAVKENFSRSDSIPLLSKVKKIFTGEKHRAYIKGLFLIVFFHWLIFNLLDFQYTKAVYQNVSSVILEAGSGFEHAFVHDLGILFILFSTSALLVQFFLGSRLVNYLGVVGSMLLHPIVTLLSLFGLTISFNFNSAVLAKNNFTITSVIHTNTYHSAYYAIREDLRGHVREILEGIVRPIGAIAGTMILIVLQRFFVDDQLVFYVNILMIVATCWLFYVTYLQQEKYTQVAADDLLNSSDRNVRFDAIDILAQKGHKSSIPVLIKVMLDNNESISLRIKILRALADFQNSEMILEIIKCLDSDKSAIREAALETIASYKILKGNSQKNLFLKFILIDRLKKLYQTEENEDVLSKIIRLMSILSNITTVEFLFDVLKSAKGQSKIEAIYALARYNDEDVAVSIVPYLKSRHQAEQIYAAIALFRFKKFRDDCFHLISSFIFSDVPSKIAYGLFAIGELRLKNKRKLCLKLLDSNDLTIKMNAAIALAKMACDDAIPALIELLFSENAEVSRKTKKMLRNVDVRISKNVDRILRHLAVTEVEKLLKEDNVDSLSELKNDKLEKLKWLYGLVEEYEQVEAIDNLIKI